MTEITTNKLLVTFLVCAYNQERVVHEAIEGAFSQTYSPLEIIISDDCSTDNTFEIAQKMAASYCGPHSIVLNRNESNLGIAQHVNHVFELAQGEFIICSAGDDISFPERTQRQVDAYLKSGKHAVLIHSDVIKIDQEGKEQGIWKPPVTTQRLSSKCLATSESIYIGATGAYSREMIQSFELIKFEHAYEDLVWGFRAALLDGLIYVDQPLLKYRIGAGITSLDACSLGLLKFIMWLMKRREAIVDVFRQRLRDLELVSYLSSEKIEYAIKQRLAIKERQLSMLRTVLGQGNGPPLPRNIMTSFMAIGLEFFAIGRYIWNCAMRRIVKLLM